MAYLTQYWNILQVAFGLGFVIFLHELGHFLLAKWNGVKVEKFSIGFGPTLLGFKRGETEYVLAAVPLGGFVKMLGEGLEEGEATSNDPRAYPNKSVGARMAIISAGVIMNLFLGLVCFVWSYGRGMEESPAIIGSVFAGQPAYEAGIRAGDQILAIDGRSDVSFNNILLKVRLSRSNQAVNFDLKHPGEDGIVTVGVKPQRLEGVLVPMIGVTPASSLILADEKLAPFPPRTEKTKDLKEAPSAGDRILAVGPAGETPKPISTILEYHQILARYRDRPLTLTMEHTPAPTKDDPRPKPRKVDATLPPNHFVDFGFRLTPGSIASVQGGSIADKAGFRKGDKIVKVDGHDDFDPMRLPDFCYDHAGKELEIEVERAESGGSPKRVVFKIVPDQSPPWIDYQYPPGQLVDVPGLGLALAINTRIAAIVAGSPADAAGLKAGNVIEAVTFPDLKPPKKTFWSRIFGHKKPQPITFNQGDTWVGVFMALQLGPIRSVDLTIEGSKKPISITPKYDPTWPHPLRGLVFEQLLRQLPPLGVSAALQRGFDDTVDNVLSIYATLRSLVMGRVSPKMLGGPGTIATVAYHSANAGLTKLIHFLGILSINLAVLNFLPIPPLDGGQMAFLIAEKVRGRPLPERALAAGTWAGLFLVLSLMAFVIFQDVVRLAGF